MLTATLETIRAMSNAGSELVMDCWYPPDEPSLVSSARRWTSNLLSLLSEPVTFSLHPEDADPFLRRLGFRLRELADAESLRRRYSTTRPHLYPPNYVQHAVVDAVGSEQGNATRRPRQACVRAGAGRADVGAAAQRMWIHTLAG